jgi:hypothetical protein
MSYSLVDTSKGPVAHLASVGGMNDLLDFVQRLRVWGPLSNFLNTGETADVQGVINEITQFAPYCTDANVKDTLLNLKQGLEQVQGTAMIVD